MGKVLKKGKFSLYEICWTLLRVVKEREGPIFLTDEEVTNSFRVSISMGYVTQVVAEGSKKRPGLTSISGIGCKSWIKWTDLEVLIVKNCFEHFAFVVVKD